MELQINNRIYDISNYFKKHPGGNIITFMKNQDATEAFRQFHHRSDRAKKILEKLPSREIKIELPNGEISKIESQSQRQVQNQVQTTKFKLSKETNVLDDSTVSDTISTSASIDSNKSTSESESTSTSDSDAKSMPISKSESDSDPASDAESQDSDEILAEFDPAIAPLTKKNLALLEDFRKLESDLTKEGYFEPSIGHVIYRISEVVIMHIIGLAFTSYGFGMIGDNSIDSATVLTSDSWPFTSLNSMTMTCDSAIIMLNIVLGIIITGIAQGRCGWLMHEGGHYSLTGNMAIDRRLHEFIYGFGCGMSGSWWRNQHNKHHATPQKHGHDVDLNTLPLVAFHKECVLDTKFGKKMMRGQIESKTMTNNKSDTDTVTESDTVTSNSIKSSKISSESSDSESPKISLSYWSQYWLKNQAALFSPIICLLVALGWQFYLHPRHCIRKSQYQELIYMGLRYAFYGWFLHVKLSLPISASLLWYLIYVQIGSSYIFTNFAVSHTHLPTVDKDDTSTTWVHYASDHTMNVGINSKLVSWWMGYLNFQIEHHLFPQMPQFRFPQISHRVKELFETHGREYLNEGYWKSIRITLDNLDQVAQEAIEEFRDVN